MFSCRRGECSGLSFVSTPNLIPSQRTTHESFNVLDTYTNGICSFHVVLCLSLRNAEVEIYLTSPRLWWQETYSSIHADSTSCFTGDVGLMSSSWVKQITSSRIRVYAKEWTTKLTIVVFETRSGDNLGISQSKCRIQCYQRYHQASRQHPQGIRHFRSS